MTPRLLQTPTQRGIFLTLAPNSRKEDLAALRAHVDKADRQYQSHDRPGALAHLRKAAALAESFPSLTECVKDLHQTVHTWDEIDVDDWQMRMCVYRSLLQQALEVL